MCAGSVLPQLNQSFAFNPPVRFAKMQIGLNLGRKNGMWKPPAPTLSSDQGSSGWAGSTQAMIYLFFIFLLLLFSGPLANIHTTEARKAVDDLLAGSEGFPKEVLARSFAISRAEVG